MKSLIYKTSKYCFNQDIGIFIIRLAAGLVFVMEGWQKFQNLSGAEHLMQHFGLPIFMGPFIATLEFFGGLALIFGLFTRIFGVIFGIEMLFVIFLSGFGRGISSHNFEILLSAVSFGIAFIGSGKYAIFPMECPNCGGMLCSDCKK